jgi:hypothetical protein
MIAIICHIGHHGVTNDRSETKSMANTKMPFSVSTFGWFTDLPWASRSSSNKGVITTL